MNTLIGAAIRCSLTFFLSAAAYAGSARLVLQRGLLLGLLVVGSLSMPAVSAQAELPDTFPRESLSGSHNSSAILDPQFQAPETYTRPPTPTPRPAPTPRPPVFSGTGAEFSLGSENGSQPWNGDIDEVAVWIGRNDLTISEVQQLYNNGAGLPFRWFL
jgi:hypothetical protein